MKFPPHGYGLKLLTRVSPKVHFDGSEIHEQNLPVVALSHQQRALWYRMRAQEEPLTFSAALRVPGHPEAHGSDDECSVHLHRWASFDVNWSPRVLLVRFSPLRRAELLRPDIWVSHSSSSGCSTAGSWRGTWLWGEPDERRHWSYSPDLKVLWIDPLVQTRPA